MRIRETFLLVGLLTMAATMVRADPWPSRPVKIVVPFGAGGNTDIIGRIVAQDLSAAFGQPFIVENRTGAAGVIGAEAVARAPADGYTLLMATQPQLAIVPALSKTPYDPIKDFAPISNIGTNPFVLVARPGLPVNTVAELVDYQSPALAEHYLGAILTVAGREDALPDTEGTVTAAVARNLFKLLAYKDEYEVARLYLRAGFAAAVEERFEAPVRVSYNLHPPLARRLGSTRKLHLGPWFRVVFRMLRAGRRLRGTPLDPFGLQRSRREERELIAWYRALLERALPALETHPALVAEIAELPASIRGYEELKTRRAERARIRGEQLLAQLERPPTGPVLEVIA